MQGVSVFLSSNGDTLAIGASSDANGVGATWVFTRSGTTWTQQGNKLVGSGYALESNGFIGQGYSVGLSFDGNTLAVGGYGDNNGVGATWVFTRSGTTWSQVGSKLIGSGAAGLANQGIWVYLSGDASTLAFTGPSDNNSTGATWIFTVSGSTWTQQGNKLVGTGAVGSGANQGWSIALSSDGSILASGGVSDNNQVGATWVFTRSGTTWSQLGSKLVGTGYVNDVGSGVAQGNSIALSGNGGTLAVGGNNDNDWVGATWVFVNGGTSTPTPTSTPATSAAPTILAGFTGFILPAIVALLIRIF